MLTTDSPKAADVRCIVSKCNVTKVLQILGVTARVIKAPRKKKTRSCKCSSLPTRLFYCAPEPDPQAVFTKMAAEENKLLYQTHVTNNIGHCCN